MFDQFPFLAQYYYNTATENDGFIAVTNPLGYAYSDMFPESFLPDAIEQSAELLSRYNIPSVYAYKHYNGAGVSTYRGVVISNNYDFHKLGSFAEATGTELTFLFDPALQTQRVYTQFGGLLYNHVNDETFYANVTDLNVAAQRITNKLSSQSTPNFLLAGYQRFRQDGTNVGGNNPADITIPRLKTLMDLIKSDPDIGDKVEFVTPERFTWLLQKSLEPTSVVNVSDFKTEIQAYLNQSGNLQLNVSSDKVSRLMVRVFDISGKVLMEKHWGIDTGDNCISLSAGHLTRGIYLVNFSSSSFSHTIKVVK
ncbi:MAG: T9SS type A sorting domain-containing protein [Bacteroidales bacterium]|nr:T9SS type A sorting domain-containing protein [Bacteroidales bacterium]